MLLVDDERSIRLVLHRTLARDGWVVEEAGDGLGAQALLRDPQRRWAAVILDVAMPGMSGAELYRWLQTERPDVAARVVLTSGAPCAFLDSAACPVLYKPFDIETARDLVRLVSGVLRDD